MKEFFESDFFMAILLFALIIGMCVMIPVMGNQAEKEDYNLHAVYINKHIILNNDTVKVLEWRTGRYDNRGYVLSNGLTVDELVVKTNCID